jgi:hypothetical protein
MILKGVVMKEKELFSRRSFIAGGAGIVLGALALSGCTGGTASGGNNGGSVEWDEETDVVVVGFGGAGSSAAIGASDAGANVIVLEKAPEGQEGGNTSVSGGGSNAGFYEFPGYIYAQFPPNTISDDEAEATIEALRTLPEWGAAHGANNTAEAGSNLSFSLGNGYSLFQWLKGVAEGSAGVTIKYSAPAKRLIFDPETKEVFGVVAEQDGQEINIKAKRGVVMACGGFENNKYMLTAYYPPAVPIYACGTPYNTGDGIPMVAALGAKMRGFGSVEWGCHCCKAGSEEIGVALAFNFLDADAWSDAIMVNAKGKRFVNETAGIRYPSDFVQRPLHSKEQIPELALSPHPFSDELPALTYEYDNLPMYLICGETKISTGGALFSAAAKDAGNHWASLRGLYTWSDDNQAEIEKGWVIKADTLEELAEKMGIDPDGLVATVKTYDANCVSGADTEFGREHLLNPIGEGPYYACELAMSLINTQGGPAKDGIHRVLAYDDQPIPRLYAGGEFGSIYVFNYPGALNVPESMAARYAGEHAAGEEPWS